MKIERHTKIVELISKYDIETQEELADKLNDSGFNVTQATVSRDIRELKLTKVATDGNRQKYVVLQSQEGWMSEKFIRVLQDGFINMTKASNILVIKTVSGMAMAVAAALDSMQFKEVLGCVAGDDTIFCATRNEEEILVLMDKLRKIIGK
ncbi:ArgR family transcriptional regulator [Lachnotalea glycerini]|uniref:Arginine repressor n=1 Tax=Lachnotalea glycerini TaxID=1763509 RepID=A0A255I4E5_9FIRM|nr:arginine repressor [Lachnotalea glycerini]PXV93568.1 ArgR family transcriptional regulator [Lachnotalea glycerini]RDY32526.1 arginine repressor [Lachnotalea glycerini]